MTPLPIDVVLTPPPLAALEAGAAIKTPAPLSLETPPPVNKTPPPATATPGPVMTKTPPPVAAVNRDPSSVLPTIPAARKESSGAFPLPGMAPPDGVKNPDEDVTLIARLSLLDDLAEESTKVEPIEAALRAAASKDDKADRAEPINLGAQATLEREKALGGGAPSALERMMSSEFEDRGDDEELTVSATPGIISVEDDEEDETTASQRPLSPTTEAPTLSGATPPPQGGGPPRLPAPTPVPGRTMHVPTPSGGLPSLLSSSLSTSASGPSRSRIPALPIPAPLGAPTTAMVGPTRSAMFKTIQLPLGGIALMLLAVGGFGFVLGAYLWQGSPPPVVAEAPAKAPTPTPPAVAPEPEPAVVAAEPAKVEAPAANPQPKAAPVPASKPTVAEGKPEPAVSPTPPTPPTSPTSPAAEVADSKPVRRVAVKPAVRKPAQVTPPVAAAKPAVVAAPKPTPVVKPAAKPTSIASSKPAKPEKAKGKGWVDPFAE